MEVLCKRFSLASKMIFKNLDDQGLIRTKESSRKISGFLDNERFLKIRIINIYVEHFEGYEDEWKIVVQKSSTDFIKGKFFSETLFLEH